MSAGKGFELEKSKNYEDAIYCIFNSIDYDYWFTGFIAGLLKIRF